MAYPTLEQYNEALQHPETAFIDSEIRQATSRQLGSACHWRFVEDLP